MFFRSVEFISDNGKRVTIGRDPPYMLTNAPKDSLSSASQVVKPPGFDGAVEYGVTRDRRAVALEGVIIAVGSRARATQAELDRIKGELVTAFDPKRFGTLIYHSANGDFRLSRCRAPSIPQFGTRFGEQHLSFTVELVSENSLWESDAELRASIGSTYSCLRFPWFMPDEGYPMNLSFLEAAIYNTTTVDVRPLIEVYDTGGENVTVRNDTTGTRLSISQPVGENQKMTIDTADAIVSLYEKNGEVWVLVSDEMLNWLTLDSDLPGFVLVPGANVLKVNDEILGARPVMIVRWRAPAVGV